VKVERRDVWSLGITLALVLLPYPSLLGFNAIPLSDDRFVSDIFGGEFPTMTAMGRQLRAGVLPGWEPGIASGVPYSGVLPLVAITFGLLSNPVAALDLYLLLVLLGAGFSGWALARRLGASAAGTVLAGVAWAHSGVMTAQMRHPILWNVLAFTPLALACLDKALDPSTDRVLQRRWFAAFGLVLGWQWAGGFPQSAYGASLLYGMWALVCVWRLHPTWTERFRRWVQFAVVSLLGAAMGAVSLLPLRALAPLSMRASGITWEMASGRRYWLPAASSFVWPYLFGDASEGTYRGTDLFWESYVYFGVLTFFAALVGLVMKRRELRVKLLGGVALAAFLFALGSHTPLFRLCWTYVPGMNNFRFPQRFLFVTTVALVSLGALGMTWFEQWLLARPEGMGQKRARVLVALLVALVALDLSLVQPRQNVMVDGRRWLSPPRTVEALRREPGLGRLYSIDPQPQHMLVHLSAHGWSDLRPYFRHRETVEPNTNLYWSIASASGYVGLAMRVHARVWGWAEEFQSGFVAQLRRTTGGPYQVAPGFGRFLTTFGVTHVVAPFPVVHPDLERVPQVTEVFLYRLRSRVGPVWFVPNAALYGRDHLGAVNAMLAPTFDPAQTVLLHEGGTAMQGEATARVTWQRTLPHEGVATVDAHGDGWVVFNETYHPDWEAMDNGRSVPVVRANLAEMAVRVGAGHHTLRWRFRATAAHRGLWVSLMAMLGLLAVWASGWRRAASR